jgi:hypothetical protein
MSIERRAFELWRERDWSCEQWLLDGRPQLRLYLDGHLMSELVSGPRINLREQSKQWLSAIRADQHMDT